MKHSLQKTLVWCTGGMGRTPATGSQVIEDPCTPADVAASALHALGIPHTHEYHTPTGRPVMIVRDGKLVEKMFG